MNKQCKKCGSYRLVPTPESNYQDFKCEVCKEVYTIKIEKRYGSDGHWGHGIG
ncbi:MAG TPA: hypothetical protein VL854_03185 [Nitrososphaeraceae archaeon]|nr:hypothetical protein [Nitrososphaeraceae archaeon]